MWGGGLFTYDIIAGLVTFATKGVGRLCIGDTVHAGLTLGTSPVTIDLTRNPSRLRRHIFIPPSHSPTIKQVPQPTHVSNQASSLFMQNLFLLYLVSTSSILGLSEAFLARKVWRAPPERFAATATVLQAWSLPVPGTTTQTKQTSVFFSSLNWYDDVGNPTARSRTYKDDDLVE